MQCHLHMIVYLRVLNPYSGFPTGLPASPDGFTSRATSADNATTVVGLCHPPTSLAAALPEDIGERNQGCVMKGQAGANER